MSAIGLRVGPFEVVEPAIVPERGQWFLGRRTGKGRRQPETVLIKLLPGEATQADRAALQVEFENLRAVDGFRVPSPLAYYDGLGALAIAAPASVPLSDVVAGRAGGDLQMSPPTLMDLGLELADTLQHAHHRGRVHGHVCPGEIGLAVDGRVWMFGFGPGPLAEALPGWSAPERARGETPTAATDQWGLGATLAALVTGRLAGLDPEAAFRPIETQWPALSRVLRKMADPNPANRYPSMLQVRQELFALARRAGGVAQRRELAGRLHRAAPDLQRPFPPEEPSEVALGPDPIAPISVVQADDPDQVETVEVSRTDVPLAPGPRVATLLPEPPSGPELEPALLTERSARPAPQRGQLPDEQIPVVRPYWDDDLPLASVAPTVEPVPGTNDPASAPDLALAGIGAGARILSPAPADVLLDSGDPPSESELSPTDRRAPPRDPSPAPEPPVPTPRPVAQATVELDDDDAPVSVGSIPVATPLTAPSIATQASWAAVELGDLEEDGEEPAAPSDGEVLVQGHEPGLPARDDETDGFHLPADLRGGSTVIPGRSEPGTGPVFFGPTLAMPSPALAPSGDSGDASSLGDGWFGPRPTASGAAVEDIVIGPSLDVDAATTEVEAPDLTPPLRIAPVRPSVAQRVAPVSVAMMAVSLGVWAVVRLWVQV
jgi:hypothetical protein